MHAAHKLNILTLYQKYFHAKYCMYTVSSTIAYGNEWKRSGQLNNVPCNLGMQSLYHHSETTSLIVSSLGPKGLLAVATSQSCCTASIDIPEPNLNKADPSTSHPTEDHMVIPATQPLFLAQ